ncbi:AAA+-type ATPase (ISS) [Micractinium conductrix]|uniref:AAA+-type ATPase (ISS) n=1 Tax=Micractinium conductrix TaxID=554055 RepID=A0A2P6V6U8_9CHLO|nr:AAA+-type ATPase (ISS) [Micractinium conductrix]|eukprot:PSC69812.1 AAA+-type ATPase (ISS) [Micractinium conductrix]
MVEELLRELKKQPGLEGPLSARILDDGDAVAAWEGSKLAAVLFPTGETLGEVRKIADARKDGLVLIINPQWQGGNVISDLGFLPWQRKANEELVAGFRETYVLRQLRMNSDEVKLLLSYPSPWAVCLRRPEAPTQNECVAQRPQQPTYKELEVLLRSVPWSMSSKPLGERLQYEAKFIRASLDPLPRDQQLPPDGGQ